MKNIFLTLLLSLVSEFVCSNEFRSKEFDGSIYMLENALRDGQINYVEAYALSRIFFKYSGVGCGAPGDDIKKEAENWAVNTLEGMSARPGTPILIHRESGNISYGGSTVTLKELLILYKNEKALKKSKPTRNGARLL